jgi:hypothetical protein
LDKTITYVGLDVHKDTIAVALAEVGPGLVVGHHETFVVGLSVLAVAASSFALVASMMTAIHSAFRTFPAD